ncbi:hypothetical protein K469DRAFT_280982 [Zopfia rhizophila CBS 207.26]|uniref:Uncharacterized protein n=1 Tax=Zopfia rhizophila CBS 207.26 TaxID=1314779 RepID=A0A6A6EQH5_9PEZI|nr:hypothetical protein K469DRAFT_280982 [Zopfia rhizophila CBS 207.26]
MCQRMIDVWTWRAGQTSVPNNDTSASRSRRISNSLATPGCTPTGSEFCNSSWVPATSSTSNPRKLNNAVVSGLMLTSPTICHFL